MVKKVIILSVSDPCYDRWKSERVPFLKVTLFAGLAFLIPPLFIAASFVAIRGTFALEDGQMLMRQSYLVVGGTCLAYTVATHLSELMESWTDVLKDELFLEDTELLNFDEQQTAAAQGDTSIGTLPDTILHQGPPQAAF